MKKNIPIALCLFTSTRGHFGISTYLDTLNYLSKQIPLSDFGALYAHIKVDPNNEELGIKMEKQLLEMGFTVEKTTASWSRGMSMQNSYLLDMRKASQSRVLSSQPYMMLLEDDGFISTEQDDLISAFSRMIGFLDTDSNIVSTRFIRKNDFESGVPVLKKTDDYFFSPYLDFQQGIYRFRDFFIANKIIEENWEQASKMQCEMVMRLAFNRLSRSELCHIVWLPSYGHSIHIGTEEYAKSKKASNL